MTDAKAAGPSGYTHVRELAHGGMGTVALAVRTEGAFRKLYAIKRMHPHMRDDEDLRPMFLDEARLAGLFAHPNLVGGVDFGEDASGPFLVMEYVDGIDLLDLQRTTTRGGTRLPLQLAVRVSAEIARGLHAAHELRDHDGAHLGLVHRDLSPRNVLISWDGAVRLTDFGIAKAIGRRSRTSTGVLKGKMAYMSPEMLRFEDPDRRSDLYALGVVLYEMVSGRRLYGGKDTNETARRILSEAPPDVGEERPDCPPELVALIFDLLAKSREDRPETAAIVAQRLDAIVADLLTREEPVELSTVISEVFGAERVERRESNARAVAEALAPTPTPARSTQSRRRRSRAPLLAVVAALILGAGASWAISRAFVGEGDAVPDAPERRAAAAAPGPSAIEAEPPSVAAADDPVSAATPIAVPIAAAADDPEPATNRERSERRRRPRASSRPEQPDPAPTAPRSKLPRWNLSGSSGTR